MDIPKDTPNVTAQELADSMEMLTNAFNKAIDDTIDDEGLLMRVKSAYAINILEAVIQKVKDLTSDKPDPQPDNVQSIEDYLNRPPYGN